MIATKLAITNVMVILPSTTDPVVLKSYYGVLKKDGTFTSEFSKIVFHLAETYPKKHKELPVIKQYVLYNKWYCIKAKVKPT